MNKQLLAGAVLSLVLTSCGENTQAYKNLQARFDSLEMVNQTIEADLQESDELVASVLTNFQEITAVEGMINTNPMNGDLKKGEKERIKDNIQLITDKLRASNEALETLTKKLEAGNAEGKRLRATITALKKELELQKTRIMQLTEELQRKDIAIGVLDSMVTKQSEDLDRLNQTAERQAAELAHQERELNRVHYCIGTASDLRDMKLLKGGKVVTEGANLDYMTEADLREFKQLPLMSKKAKLLTLHPANSYALVPDGDKHLTLQIKDAKAFWSSAKMLIIQVD